ncbi:MAG TPA: OB-fold domain-containing protein [Acidimicrobiales bacterium]|nr:OB-fold domain-containing protein [Acidimicrobiales bacterium]
MFYFPAMAESEVLRSPHVIEYTYTRSTGPVIGAFLTGLRDGTILGATSPSGRVVVPPTEYDPITSEEVGELVEVGPAGVVTTWAWASVPQKDQPLDRPFAWALVQLDGADTAMLHVVDAPGPDAMRSGMRVTARWRPAAERIGHMLDIECFVAEGSG